VEYERRMRRGFGMRGSGWIEMLWEIIGDWSWLSGVPFSRLMLG